MKLIIDIADDIYEYAKNMSYTSLDEVESMKAIANGIPLPKGHGDLVDKDELLKYGSCPIDCERKDCPFEENDYKFLHCKYRIYDIEDINDVPTIIEADRSEE